MTNLKFELYINEEPSKSEYGPKIGQKMARIFWKDKSYNSIVQNHPEYGEYIVVPNYLRKGNSLEDEFFTYRPKDFVESVKNGDADVMDVSDFFVHTEHALYFLDREIGEKLRQKSIEGLKDSEFDIAIFKSGSFGGMFLTESNRLCSTILFNSVDEKFKTNEKIRYFYSEEEAETAIEEIYRGSEELINHYNSDENFKISDEQLHSASFYLISETKENVMYVNKSLIIRQMPKKKEE